MKPIETAIDHCQAILWLVGSYKRLTTINHCTKRFAQRSTCKHFAALGFAKFRSQILEGSELEKSGLIVGQIYYNLQRRESGIRAGRPGADGSRWEQVVRLCAVDCSSAHVFEPPGNDDVRSPHEWSARSNLKFWRSKGPNICCF